MDDIFEVQCYRLVIDSAEILEMSWIEVIVNVGTELLTYWNSQVNIDITTELLTKRTVFIHTIYPRHFTITPHLLVCYP